MGAELPILALPAAQSRRNRWRLLLSDLSATKEAILHPCTSANRVIAFWHNLASGGLVVDTPDPKGRWPILLRTTIQLDGDVTNFVERGWLETTTAAELQATAQVHFTQIALRFCPLDDLRGIERATWYAAGCVSLLFTILAGARRHDWKSLIVSAGTIIAPILLRWAAPHLLRALVRHYWDKLEHQARTTNGI
jgi:hypothetical protein